MPPHATLPPHVQRLQRHAWLVGLVCAALCLVGYFLQPSQFFRSYLMAYMFWLGVVLGCLAILMVHHLVGGAVGHGDSTGARGKHPLTPLDADTVCATIVWCL